MSTGLNFRTCWIPLAEIDADIGGMIFAEGVAQQVDRHEIEPDGSRGRVPIEHLPADCWRHTTFQAGDLLMVHPWTPHSGIRNISDRFRLSVDLRVFGSRDILPAIGDVVSIAVDRIEVRDVKGNVTALRIGPDTYVRTSGKDGGKRYTGEGILKAYPPGTPAIVGHDGKGLATMVRPPAGSPAGTPFLVHNEF